MSKFRLNYAQLCLLVIAFLTVQFSTSHLHLAEIHSHDGTLHQHQVKAHSHQYITTLDISQSNHSTVIEFEEDYKLQKRTKQQTQSIDVANIISDSLSSIPLLNIQIQTYRNTQFVYFSNTSSNPRAPPLNS